MTKYLIALILSAYAFSSNAQSPISQVYPVIGFIGSKKSEFSPQSNIALFYLSGENSKYSLTYEISIYKWSDKGLEPTNDLMVFPPVKKIEIGKKYPIKVISKVERTDLQQSYRIVFTQKELVNPADSKTIAIPFSFSIPLFVEPLGQKTVDIESTHKDGITYFKNNGNSMYRTATITIDNNVVNQLTYILPKQTIEVKGNAVLGKEY